MTQQTIIQVTNEAVRKFISQKERNKMITKETPQKITRNKSNEFSKLYHRTRHIPNKRNAQQTILNVTDEAIYITEREKQLNFHHGERNTQQN
jgi:hypothetical protein